MKPIIRWQQIFSQENFESTPGLNSYLRDVICQLFEQKTYPYILHYSLQQLLMIWDRYSRPILAILKIYHKIGQKYDTYRLDISSKKEYIPYHHKFTIFKNISCLDGMLGLVVFLLNFCAPLFLKSDVKIRIIQQTANGLLLGTYTFEFKHWNGKLLLSHLPFTQNHILTPVIKEAKRSRPLSHIHMHFYLQTK